MSLAPCVVCDRPTAIIKVGWFGIPPEVICGICLPVLSRQLRPLLVKASRRIKSTRNFCEHVAENHIPSDWDASRPCIVAGCPCLGGHV